MPSRPSRGRTRHILRVPILEDDAVERKRVLNILAQRRYRERKREGKGAGRSVEGVQQNRKSGEVGRSTPPNDSPKDRVGTQEAAEGVEMPLLHHTSESALEYWIEQGMQPDVHSMSDAWLWPENTPLDDMLFSASDLDFSVPFPPSSAAGTALSSILQEHQTSTTSFPDTYLLPVPALGLLRACLAIATRLGVEKLIWDFGALSPFYSPSNSTSLSSLSEAFPSSSSGVSESVPFSSIGSGIDEMTLPENMRPTLTQRLLPHHPLLDILPWPSVRDKLIMLFSQAQDVMPSELNLGQFVADAEDSADGVRIAGITRLTRKGGRWVMRLRRDGGLRLMVRSCGGDEERVIGETDRCEFLLTRSPGIPPTSSPSNRPHVLRPFSSCPTTGSKVPSFPLNPMTCFTPFLSG